MEAPSHRPAETALMDHSPSQRSHSIAPPSLAGLTPATPPVAAVEGIVPIDAVAPPAAVRAAPRHSLRDLIPAEPLHGLLLVAVQVALTALVLAVSQGEPTWQPAAGVAVAAVTLGGARWITPVLAGALLSSLVAGATFTPALAAGITFTASTYAVAGLVLRRRLDLRRPLARVSDAWWLIGVGLIAAPVVAGLGRVIYDPAIAEPILRTGMVAAALGIAAVAPGAIVWNVAHRRAGSGVTRRVLLTPEAIAVLAVLIALTPVVVFAADEILAIAPLPLCWMALRFALPGAVLGAFAWTSTSFLTMAITGEEALGPIHAFLLAGTMLALIIGAVVSERDRTQNELRRMVMYDRFSGLPNETYLVQLIDEAIAADQSATGSSLLVLRFAGLRQVGAALRRDDVDRLVALLVEQVGAICGPTATIARPAFDRFAVLLDGPASVRREQIAEKLIDELGAPLPVGSREVLVDPRIGITTAMPGEGGDVILAHADHAADVAAVADGERIAYYDASTEREQRERQELTEDLRVAVERGDFLLAFQPIVTAKDGVVTGAEALLRWVDRKRGPVSPADFVPIAEETGLILPIGRWVLNEACSRAARWPHVAGRPITVSVNVSPIQLLDEGFLKDVASALQLSGLPPERLRLEITEGLMLHDVERTIQMIGALREMGVETMLDDFGTGHSSLAWVQRLPVSCIKIDRAFINDVANDGIDRAIVHASLYLSRALGTETVAEGVETEAQREQLVRMGCQKLQGYLFARPQPADVFPDWLARQRAAVEAEAEAAQPTLTAVQSPAPRYHAA